MKLPNITHFVGSSFTYAPDFFKEASWKGKTVQVLCCLSLIILAISLLRRFTKPKDSGGDSNLVGRVTPPSIDLPKAITPASSGTVAIVPYHDKPFYTELSANWTGELCDKGIDEEITQWEAALYPNWLGRMRGVRGWLKQTSFEVDYAQRVKDYPKLNSPDLFEEFQRLKALKTLNNEDKKYCLAFKGWIAKLKEFDQAWYAVLKQGLDIELKNITYREFASLPEYIQHLNPDPKEDGACFGIKRENFMFIGVVSMADISVLQLQVFEPHIARLEQFLTCMIYTLGRNNKCPVAPLEQEIQQFKAAIDKILGSPVSAIEGVEPILKDFKNKLNIIKAPYTSDSMRKAVQDLNEFKNKDWDRQRLCLKDYVLQNNIWGSWKWLFLNNEIYTLEQYCEKKDIQDAGVLYQIGLTIS
jgi:hypothetical protein